MSGYAGADWIMKALTLYQPWATLVAIGAKRIETRSWGTNYRGPLAIHAGKNRRFVDCKSPYYVCSDEPFYSILTDHARKIVEQYQSPLDQANRIMPLGAIMAVCELVDCHYILKPGQMFLDQNIEPFSIPDEPERSFGDYTPGRFAWILKNIKSLPDPISIRGMQGLWDWYPQS